jgi:hypothetical protein
MICRNGPISTIDIFSTAGPNFKTVSRVGLTIGCFTVKVGTVHDDIVAYDYNNEEKSSSCFGYSVVPPSS